jgi:hypothetical protein
MMGQDADKTESEDAEQKPPKINAEDNPWYLNAEGPLATVEVPGFEEINVWNYYFTTLDEENSTKFKEAFAEHYAGKNVELPDREADIDFSNIEFDSDVSFNGYVFTNLAKFDGAAFSGVASFDRTKFSSAALFDDATFSKWVSFRGATFSGAASFEGATFSKRVSFDGATTFSEATFDGAKFQEESSFVNAKMKAETSFEGATFKTVPPKFFGAKLHEGTVWRGIQWPRAPKEAREAGRFVDAYERLKLEMDRLKKHEDELDFFAREMESRRVLLGTWTGLPIAIYGTFSDYGRNYFWPLVALFYLAVIGTLAFLTADSLAPWQSFGLSAANMLNVFGLRKDFFDSHLIENLPAWLKVIAAVQTIFGAAFLFLFGLGLRNRFRMK